MPDNIKMAEKDTVIHIRELTRQFEDLIAVNKVSFDIYRNEIFGLLGPNGAGKTTTINMLCGLLPSTSGEIQFRGFNGKDIKSLIGYCPQDNIYYPKLTCMEQLLFIGQMYGIEPGFLEARASELLHMLGLAEKSRTLASKLSGGMKRRLNICLALIHDPEILVLDEPEAGLDPQSRLLVRDFIKTFGNKKTVILTTHNMDEADRLADRIAIIDHGKLLLLDTPSNLKKTIGEGDILEICFENGKGDEIDRFADEINRLSMSVKINQTSVLIKHPGILDHIGDIRAKAEHNGLTITEIRLRENTLEDVFIHLTGRSLRQ